MPQAVPNLGNIVTHRAFVETGRIEILRQTVNKKMSTAYKMTEELPPRGSGSPSPLYVLCELIRKTVERDIAEGRTASTAQELAEYPLQFFKSLFIGNASEESPPDVRALFNTLFREAGAAMGALNGGQLEDMSPRDLKAERQRLMTVASAASTLQTIIDAVLEGKNKERSTLSAVS